MVQVSAYLIIIEMCLGHCRVWPLSVPGGASIHEVPR